MLSQNLTEERPTFVSHLECSKTGEQYPCDQVHNLSAAGKPLLVRYDLENAVHALDKETLKSRPMDIWRYRELLPVRKYENIVSLGESVTPIIALPHMAQKLGTKYIYVKDEGRMPTGCFKARGMALAVSMAKEFDLTRLAVPTAGNAGAALAAYASRAGIESYVFTPEDTLPINIQETAYQGANTYLINGFINDGARVVADGTDAMNWFDMSTLKEPYRIEGKKTMGLELAEQFDWQLPDVIFYPTGGGTGLIAMWKAFEELAAMGWIGAKRPRMVVVQTTGCAPIVRAFDHGKDHSEPWQNPATQIHGCRAPVAIGDFIMLKILKYSNGFAIAVTDEAAEAARAEVAKEEGFLMCPEGGATYAAYTQALAAGNVDKKESVVLFNTASGLKAPMPEYSNKLDITKPVDYGKL